MLFESSTKEGRQEPTLLSDEPVARQLEEGLMRLKAQLRSSNEQHKFQAEELEASNEELQSINEELRTVNQELKIKIEEISISSNNLQNLINSTNIATIFLDRSFRVVLFTPPITGLFNLITSDYGRLITDITHRLNYADLVYDAEAVLETLTVQEREVATVDNRVFVMRILPYRTGDDRINGVVITFIDITKRKEAEKAIAEDLKATQILHELSTRLVSEDNVDVVYPDILGAAILLTKADAGTFQLLDEKNNELLLLAAEGFPQKLTGHFRHMNAGPQTSIGRSLLTAQRTFADFDTDEDPDGLLRLHTEAGYFSAQSTPFIMPVMNGWQALCRLKEVEAFSHIPVIVYSTSSYPEDVEKAAHLGAVCFFSKPPAYKLLKNSIGLVMEHLNADSLPLLCHRSPLF